jgi:hypothetical protein
MNRDEVCVVTITLARDVQEERVLLKGLAKLSDAGLPVVIADGGSRKSFVKGLLDSNYFIVVPQGKGLVQQVKAAVAAGLQRFNERRAILYTEPDKYRFFEKRLVEFVQAVKCSDKLGVAAAARNQKSFRTFPKGQFQCESFMNEAFSWTLRQKGDYCYGPLLLSRAAAKMSLNAPDELGWGWRFWTMKKAFETGLRVSTVEMDLPCPVEQRGEDSSGERVYRLMQLKQNLDAITR